MTDCPNAEMRDRLPDLVTERLSPADRVAVVAHVGQCADCSAEVEILRLARSVMIDATPAVNVAGIVGALSRQTGSARARSSARSWGSSWRIAAAVTILAAGAGSYSMIRRPASVDSTAVSVVVAENSAGLALTGGLADLNDAELQALVDHLGKIEALPDPNVEGEPATVSGPTGGSVPDSAIRDSETGR